MNPSGENGSIPMPLNTAGSAMTKADIFMLAIKEPRTLLNRIAPLWSTEMPSRRIYKNFYRSATKAGRQRNRHALVASTSNGTPRS